MLDICAGSADSALGAKPAAEALFDKVWLAHRPRIARLVTRLSGDPGAVDDLLQEIGVHAFQGFPRFRRDSAAYTWLYRIAVNTVQRWRETRHETVPLDSAEASKIESSGAGPEQQALCSSLVPAVRAALDILPEEQRAVLVLQLYEGLRYREIAQVLDIPIGTVKSRVSAAMRRMKKELAGYAV